MAENTEIEWADHTFNPWEGCQKVGPGCDHCYAETRNARYNGGVAPNWGPGAPRRRTSAANWKKPRRWAKAARAFYEQHGRRQRVFCASLADVFDNAVPVQWRIDLFELILETPDIDWLILTKRIGNVQPMLEELGLERLPENVWLGATIVNQTEADRDIPKLLAVPAAVRFLSMEPLLGSVDLEVLDARVSERGETEPSGLRWIDALTGDYSDGEGHVGDVWGMPNPGLGWIIVGGESGPGARPMHPDWARSLRDQCAAAGVAFLFKQWGEWAPPTIGLCSHFVYRDGRVLNAWDDAPIEVGIAPMTRVGKKLAGRLLDGVEHNGYPGAA